MKVPVSSTSSTDRTHALGIACTQACGLMSAQFGSEAKRMQHGVAARNGVLATLLARGGYIGIKKVFEQGYGGFLTQFSAGNGKIPNNHRRRSRRIWARAGRQRVCVSSHMHPWPLPTPPSTVYESCRRNIQMLSRQINSNLLRVLSSRWAPMRSIMVAGRLRVHLPRWALRCVASTSPRRSSST